MQYLQKTNKHSHHAITIIVLNFWHVCEANNVLHSIVHKFLFITVL